MNNDLFRALDRLESVLSEYVTASFSHRPIRLEQVKDPVIPPLRSQPPNRPGDVPPISPKVPPYKLHFQKWKYIYFVILAILLILTAIAILKPVLLGVYFTELSAQAIDWWFTLLRRL